MWKLACLPPHCLVFGGCWAAEKRMTSALGTDKKWGRRAPRSPESPVSAVLAWLRSFLCTASQEGLHEWTECGVGRGSHDMPAFFQNFTSEMRLIKETLSLSKVTLQIVPDSIARHTLMQFEKRYWQAWHDGIVKWHCHTCPQDMTNATHGSEKLHCWESSHQGR